MPGDATPKADSCQEQGTTTAMEVSPVKDEERTQAQERPSQDGSGTDISDMQEQISPAGKRGRQRLASPKKELSRLSPPGTLRPDPIDDNGCTRLDDQGRQTPLHSQHRRGLLLRQQCSAQQPRHRTAVMVSPVSTCKGHCKSLRKAHRPCWVSSSIWHLKVTC